MVPVRRSGTDTAPYRLFLICYLLSAICYLLFAISFEPKARMIAFAAIDPTLVALRLA